METSFYDSAAHLVLGRVFKLSLLKLEHSAAVDQCVVFQPEDQWPLSVSKCPRQKHLTCSSMCDCTGESAEYMESMCRIERAVCVFVNEKHIVKFYRTYNKDKRHQISIANELNLL